MNHIFAKNIFNAFRRRHRHKIFNEIFQELEKKFGENEKLR